MYRHIDLRVSIVRRWGIEITVSRCEGGEVKTVLYEMVLICMCKLSNVCVDVLYREGKMGG